MNRGLRGLLLGLIMVAAGGLIDSRSFAARVASAEANLAITKTVVDVQEFLTEAIVLCLAGGLIGLALGIGTAYAIAALVGWPVLVSGTIIAVGIGASAAVSILFGYVPAQQAARLNPIGALRYE